MPHAGATRTAALTTCSKRGVAASLHGYMGGVLPIFLTLALTLAAIIKAADVPNLSSKPDQSERGIASWYGYPYHGRHAADGEIYDMEKLTAAHRTLPFGTSVRVVNLRNDKSVDVRINDRGPFVEGRIIDLSKAAARTIDLLGPGITPVRVDVIGATATVFADLFAVQVGAFRDIRNAKRNVTTMQARYGAARLSTRDGDPVLWRVSVGAETTQESALALAIRIRRESGERTAFVVRVDQ